MSDAEQTDDSRQASEIRRRDVLRGGLAISGTLGFTGCVSTTDDGISIKIGDVDDSTPTKTPTDTPTVTDTPTGSPTPTEYPTPTFSQDCLSLDPSTIAVEEDGTGGYRIVRDDGSIMLSFDDLKNANRTRDLIKHYGFTQHCFVGRPNPPFEYWLVDD